MKRLSSVETTVLNEETSILLWDRDHLSNHRVLPFHANDFFIKRKRQKDWKLNRYDLIFADSPFDMNLFYLQLDYLVL